MQATEPSLHRYRLHRTTLPAALTKNAGCYSADMYVIINGQRRELAPLVSGNSVQDLIAALELKGDRIAVEHNGSIIRRPEWATTPVTEGDSFEIVHFVGGGCQPMERSAHERGTAEWPTAGGHSALGSQSPALLRSL